MEILANSGARLCYSAVSSGRCLRYHAFIADKFPKVGNFHDHALLKYANHSDASHPQHLTEMPRVVPEGGAVSLEGAWVRVNVSAFVHFVGRAFGLLTEAD